jgi:hypothetical protein
MAIIWVAAVDHKTGTTLFAATTEAGIYAQLADYCVQWWQTDGPGGESEVEPPAGLSHREIVTRYFQYQSELGEEWHVVEEVPLAASVAQNETISE